MCAEGKVESQRLRTGKLARRRLAAAHRRVRQAREGADLRRRHGLDHDDGDPLEAAPAEVREPNLGLVIVDYLQLMTSGTSAENRVQEVSQISRALKVLARDLDVPIIALSQLSRAVEQRHDKRPILSDLRESGSIEQDADLVMFVYRDEYYNPEETESAGIAEVHPRQAPQRRRPASRSSRSRSATRSSPTWRPAHDDDRLDLARPRRRSRACASRASRPRARRGALRGCAVAAQRARVDRRATCGCRGRALRGRARDRAAPRRAPTRADASRRQAAAARDDRAAARLARPGGDVLRRAVRGVPGCYASRSPQSRCVVHGTLRRRSRRRLHDLPPRASHRHASRRPAARGRLARLMSDVSGAGRLSTARRCESRRRSDLRACPRP